MTYSIVARDAETGAVGVAVASRFFAVGGLIPFVRRDVAVASQAYCNPLWGIEAADRMMAGEGAADILPGLVAGDAGAKIRQIHMIDRAGNIAAHTGADCVGWAGHRAGKLVSVAGNMLTGPEVIDATIEAYDGNLSAPFSERLLAAMEAGERAGGDKRGRQSAALVIHQNEDWPWLNIRADDHGNPLGELRRLLDVSRERFRYFAAGLPTAANPSGSVDRGPIDRAIEEAEEERRRNGIPSRSFATPVRG